MSDFIFKGTLGGGSPETKTIPVVAGVVGTIAIGDVVTVANGYAAKVANGGASADGRYALATSNSTDTVALDGEVEVQFCPTGLLIQGTATTPGNLALGVIYDRVTMDVDGSGNQTVDENDPNGVLTIYPCTNDTNFLNGTQVVVSLPWQV